MSYQTTPPDLAVPEGAPALFPRTAWGAILAGALVAIAVGATLNILGIAVGATTIDAVNRSTPDASSFGLAASIWLVVANLLGLAAGGYVAARLSGTADKRDAALHGLATWASAFLVSAVLLGSAVSGVAHTAGNAVGSVLGGAGRAVSSAAQTAAQATPQVDQQALVNRASQALSRPNDVSAMNGDQRAAEIASIVGQGITQGNLNDGQRARLNQLIAAQAGISEQEAAQRVQQYEQQARQTAAEAEQKAREAANAAATGTAVGAFWIFATLILGAFAAILGARMGVREIVGITDRRYA